MKFRQLGRGEEDKLQLRMAPMIDMIFLTLIFFMCTTRWRAAEGNLAAELPSDGAATKDVAPIDLEKIVIKLQKAGDEVHIKMNDRLCPSFDVLCDNLKSLRQMVDVPVIIDVDREVQFRYAISALNASVKAGLANVSFAAPIAGSPGG